MSAASFLVIIIICVLAAYLVLMYVQSEHLAFPKPSVFAAAITILLLVGVLIGGAA